jgi:predicted nucleic acid-binding protein
MEGTIPDASVWITWFKPGAISSQKDKLNILIAEKKPIYICPPVYQEVLQGVRDEAVFEKTKKRLLLCRHGNFGIIQATEKAVEIYRALRKMGVTIRKPNDCLIAAYALLNDLVLLHNDRDFDPIEQHFGLRVIR